MQLHYYLCLLEFKAVVVTFRSEYVYLLVRAKMHKHHYPTVGCLCQSSEHYTSKAKYLPVYVMSNDVKAIIIFFDGQSTLHSLVA